MNEQIIIPPSVPLNAREQVDQLDKLARLLDSRWTIPGTSIRVGWDTIIGLIPGIGDTISSCISAYIFREAGKYGVPGWVKGQMAANIAIDWLIGSIPLVGDIFDIGWKANLRNIALIKKHGKY